MKLQDIIDLAKAGYSPKDVITLLEYVETSPEVKKADPEEAKKELPETKKEEAKEDAVETFKKLLDGGN